MSKLNLFLLVICITQIFTMNTDGLVEFDHESDYSGLPNEFPTLSGLGYIGGDGSDSVFKRGIIYKLKDIIGALPFPEQHAFMKSMNGVGSDSTPVFIKGTYGEYISNHKIYEKELQSFIDYLEDYERQMPYGLGCFQFTANKYVYDNDYNKNMHYLVYQNINKMIKAQKSGIQSKLKFLQVLQKNLIENRQKLLQLTQSKVNSAYNGITDSEFKNVLFSSDQKNELTEAFKKYVNEQKKFTFELGLYGIRAEVALSNMDGCRDYKEPDYSAGKSSTYIKNAKITYKKRNRKQIGVNADDEIGIENRTSNGFKLYKGFFRGATLRNNDASSSVIPSYIPREFTDEIRSFNNTLGKILKENANQDDLWKDFQTFNESIYEEDFPNKLKSDVFNEATLNSSFSDEEIQSNIQNFTDLRTKCDKSYILYCKGNGCYYASSGSDPATSIDWKKATSIKAQNIGLQYLFAYCNYDDYPLVLLQKDENNKEIIARHSLLSKAFRDAIQGCFGVFHSGGKHDKDACRDVVRSHCGTTLDYHCKKLGLYDYINSNPLINEIPQDKINADFLINKFIVGGVGIKPSSLIGSNLILQQKKDENVENYGPGSTTVDNLDPLCSYCDNKAEFAKYSVLGVNVNTKVEDDEDSHEFLVNMNKANNFILENAGNGLSFRFWNLIVLFASLFLFLA